MCTLIAYRGFESRRVRQPVSGESLPDHGTPPPPPPANAESLHHHRRKIFGRDPHEDHRVATPLELLFDLTFVIAFGAAALQLAHGIATGHDFTALAGFGLASFAICRAWINFARFAAAHDTDDWVMRLATVVPMIAVVVIVVIAAMSIVSLAARLNVLMFVRVVTIAGYKMAGHRHKADALVRSMPRGD